MLPLSFDAVAQLVGFPNGGTHWRDYLRYSKFLGGDQDRPYGSTYENSIYWKFVEEHIYYHPWFPPALKASMLAVNVYYFFFRQWCLP